jgi:hypothetical protein
MGQSIVDLRRLANRSSDDEAQSAALYLAGELPGQKKHAFPLQSSAVKSRSVVW